MHGEGRQRDRQRARVGEESLNSGAIDESTLYWAERRVLDHQRKLHRWARAEPHRRFGDLFNLVYDQATLLMAWELWAIT